MLIYQFTCVYLVAMINFLMLITVRLSGRLAHKGGRLVTRFNTQKIIKHDPFAVKILNYVFPFVTFDDGYSFSET